MFGSLYVGLSGLRAHQEHLAVIGNNLANSQTAGFKSDRMTFGDLFYQSINNGSGPVGNLGGVNPRQIGTGVQVGGVDQNHIQGALQATGRTLDLALQGGGFFALSNGSETVFTRSGTFGLDRESNVVDTRTGFKVQSAQGSDINLSSFNAIAAQATSSVTFAGNLPAEVTGPLAAQLASASAFQEHQPATMTSSLAPGATPNLDSQDIVVSIDNGSPITLTFPTQGPVNLAAVATSFNTLMQASGQTPTATASVDGGGNLVFTSDTSGSSSMLSFSGAAATTLGLPTTQAVGSEAAATAATGLNALGSNTTSYVAGDVIQLTGLDGTGNAVNISFVYGAANDGTTMGDLVNRINNSGAWPNATASLGADGKLHLDSQTTGESSLSLVIQDASGTGQTAWSNQAFSSLVEGTGPDTRATSVTVFDSQGLSHTLTGMFERQGDGSWNLELSIPSSEGTVTGGPITGITFAPDGTFQGSNGTSINIDFSSGASSQSVSLELGSGGSLDGLTQFGSETTAFISAQDGYEAGTLTSLGVNQGGVIEGFYSNGQAMDLATLGIAIFQNAEGLKREGSTVFKSTGNSGAAAFVQAGTGAAGSVVSGALEGSNVDVAEEFVKLIEAQRSFQGSARVLTTSDEMLAELLNIL